VEDCGTLNYVELGGTFKQCGFEEGQCLAEHGELVCPISAHPPRPSPPPQSSSLQPPPPPPLASSPPAVPGGLTCDIMIGTGTNLRDLCEWCASRKTAEACGTLNYVPMSHAFKQCGFKYGECLAKYGQLACPTYAPLAPPFVLGGGRGDLSQGNPAIKKGDKASGLQLPTAYVYYSPVASSASTRPSAEATWPSQHYCVLRGTPPGVP
jgi:hypothetical protein